MPTDNEHFDVTIVHVGGERRVCKATLGVKGRIDVSWGALNPPIEFDHTTGQAVRPKLRVWSLAVESRKPAGYVPEKEKNAR